MVEELRKEASVSLNDAFKARYEAANSATALRALDSEIYNKQEEIEKLLDAILGRPLLFTR